MEEGNFHTKRVVWQTDIKEAQWQVLVTIVSPMWDNLCVSTAVSLDEAQVAASAHQEIQGIMDGWGTRNQILLDR